MTQLTNASMRQGAVLMSDAGVPWDGTTPFPVATPLSVPNKTPVTFTPSASYAAGKCIGDRLVFDLGVANANKNVRVSAVLLHMLCSSTGNITGALFEGDPTGSTLADGSTGAIVQADIPKLRGGGNSGAVVTGYGIASWSVAPGRIVTTDAAGKFYFSFAATASISGITGTASAYAEWAA